MAPDWALLPLVVLATVATVIASQAVITGAFSLTQQAIQLGLLPRMEIQYTSDAQPGRSTCRRSTGCCWSASCSWSSRSRPRARWPSAYGIAVTGTMVVDPCSPSSWSGRHGAGRSRSRPLFIAAVPRWSTRPSWPRTCSRSLDGGYVPLLIAAGDHRRDVDLGARHAHRLPQDPHRPAAGRPDPPAGAQPADARARTPRSS